MGDLIRLRDLPGIAQIEAMVKSRDAFNDEHRIGSLVQIWTVSISLFSLCDYHTEWDEDWGDETERAEYEAAFSNVMADFSVTRPFWEALGWDISDGAGRELNCAHHFGRQIIALARGDFENARFTPDGSGTFCWADLQESEIDEAALEERLTREMHTFMKGRTA